MARTSQIVPKYSFPHVEVYMNDYTLVTDDTLPDDTDSTVNYLYAVVADTGIDNVFVKMSSQDKARKTFGELNFAKHGQPYAQALENLSHVNSSVWIMRVLPDNAAYANQLISAFYKADTAEDYPDAHLRKFRIKFTGKSGENLTTASAVKEALNVLDGPVTNDNYVDGEGYTQKPFLGVYASGRGSYGDIKSIRLSQNMNYEKNYGIKIYNFEILDNSNGLTLDADYIAGLVTSNKYNELTPTLIDDVLSTYSRGFYPVEVFSLESNVEDIYNEYIKFAKALNVDLATELTEKLAAYNLPEDVLNGVTAPESDEQAAQLLEINTIKALYTNTKDANLPDLDQFDLIYGRKVGSSEMLPGIFYPEVLTDDVDITADDYDPNNYTSTENVVDLSAVNGIGLENGANGYFDSPREGMTLQDEIDECYIKAFDGTYDKRILSGNRLGVTRFWDANYSFKVKQVIDALTGPDGRWDCPVNFDANIITSLSEGTVNNLIDKYAGFNSFHESIDIHNYYIRDPYTKKKVQVTITYFLSGRYIDHVTRFGIHVPFVRDYCMLEGHVRDSMQPVVEEWEVDTMQKLKDARFNYFMCIGENQFVRSVQNTRQTLETDLTEENNVTIYFDLKRRLTKDANSQLYNFAEDRIRQEFCEVERAKYANWIGRELEDFDIDFKVSEYEFNHKILHLYVSIIFRGLTKIVLIEIDINKRQYTASEDEG